MTIGKLPSFVQFTNEGVNGESLVTIEGSHFYRFYASYIPAS
jgi:hypothetical protein